MAQIKIAKHGKYELRTINWFKSKDSNIYIELNSMFAVVLWIQQQTYLHPTKRFTAIRPCAHLPEYSYVKFQCNGTCKQRCARNVPNWQDPMETWIFVYFCERKTRIVWIIVNTGSIEMTAWVGTNDNFSHKLAIAPRSFIETLNLCV